MRTYDRNYYVEIKSLNKLFSMATKRQIKLLQIVRMMIMNFFSRSNSIFVLLMNWLKFVETYRVPKQFKEYQTGHAPISLVFFGRTYTTQQQNESATFL